MAHAEMHDHNAPAIKPDSLTGAYPGGLPSEVLESRDAPLGDKPKEECGVFGVWAPGEDVAKLTYYGLYALQHRGQEAAGIAVSDGTSVTVYK